MTVDSSEAIREVTAKLEKLKGGEAPARRRNHKGVGDEYLLQIHEEKLKNQKLVQENVTGTVKWYSVLGHYGFIEVDGDGGDVFVHQSSIANSRTNKLSLRTLDKNERVQFDVMEGEKGLEAVNVTGLDGAPVVGSRFQMLQIPYIRHAFFEHREWLKKNSERMEKREIKDNNHSKKNDQARDEPKKERKPKRRPNLKRSRKDKKQTKSAETRRTVARVIQSNGQTDGGNVNKTVEAFLTDVSRLGVTGLRAQFAKVKPYIPASFNFESFTRNPNLNRYKDVVCLEETRVVLKVEREGEGDYIHANWVRLEGHDRVYIATQGPLDHTIHDFWRMCYQHEVFCIVNLGAYPSCAQYWPEKAPGHFYTMPESSGYFINNRKVEQEDKFTLTSIEVVPQGCSDGKYIKLIQFTQWPDKGVPLGNRVILRLLRLITKQDKLARGNVVVHCSAGIGRTGTIILIDWMLQSLLYHNDYVEMPKLFMELRRQRAHSIQTEGQWLFIYQSVLEYIKVRHPKLSSQIDKLVNDIRTLNLVA